VNEVRTLVRIDLNPDLPKIKYKNQVTKLREGFFNTASHQFSVRVCIVDFILLNYVGHLT